MRIVRNRYSAVLLLATCVAQCMAISAGGDLPTRDGGEVEGLTDLLRQWGISSHQFGGNRCGVCEKSCFLSPSVSPFAVSLVGGAVHLSCARCAKSALCDIDRLLSAVTVSGRQEEHLCGRAFMRAWAKMYDKATISSVLQGQDGEERVKQFARQQGAQAIIEQATELARGTYREPLVARRVTQWIAGRFTHGQQAQRAGERGQNERGQERHAKRLRGDMATGNCQEPVRQQVSRYKRDMVDDSTSCVSVGCAEDVPTKRMCRMSDLLAGRPLVSSEVRAFFKHIMLGTGRPVVQRTRYRDYDDDIERGFACGREGKWRRIAMTNVK